MLKNPSKLGQPPWKISPKHSDFWCLYATLSCFSEQEESESESDSRETDVVEEEEEFVEVVNFKKGTTEAQKKETKAAIQKAVRDKK